MEPHIVPMIYEGLQKAPVRFKIDTASVANFSVVYEELPVKGDKPGKLYFTDMNGQFLGCLLGHSTGSRCGHRVSTETGL